MEKYKVNEGRSLTLKCGIVHAGHKFGIEELTGSQLNKAEIIETLLERKVINAVKEKPLSLKKDGTPKKKTKRKPKTEKKEGE